MAGTQGCEQEERLLHLLQVGRDCVDVQLVRWFVQLPPEEDAHAFLASRRRLCASSAKTGLVKRSEATPAPRTPLREHPELESLGKLIASTVDIFVRNGNTHVSYWHVEELVAWNGAAFDCLRSHFTLPRLLAGFSLFDHNFRRKSCALSMRNFAVWGAEHCVKDRLLSWQGGQPADALVEEVLPGEGAAARRGAAEPGPAEVGRRVPRSGEFLSVAEVMRQMRWTSVFAPHVGDFLEWAWRTPGLELGLRVSSATFAMKDVQLESRDLSERAALHALVKHLNAHASLAGHIASCRQALNWREYGLGPLEKFVRKYTGWFTIDGEMIALRPEKAAAFTGAHEGEGACASDPAAAAAGLSPPAWAEGGDGGGSRHRAGEAEEEDEEEETDGEVDDAVPAGPPSGGAKSWAQALAPVPWPGTRRCIPQLFQRWGGLAYDEACLRQALQAAQGSAEARLAIGGRPPDCGAELLETLGAEVAAFSRWHRLPHENWLLRRRACEEVQAALRVAEPFAVEFPRLRVRPFGTSASGLGQRGSDLDLLLDLDSGGNGCLQRGRVPWLLEAAGEVLQAQLGLEDLQLVPRARVPLLRGALRGVRLDLSLGSRCGLWNTALLRRAVAQDPARVLPLCITVAVWSKTVGINDSPNGLLSTYSVMLLVVSYLQAAGVLQKFDLSAIAEAAASAEDDPPTASAAEEAPHTELGRLLLGFFFYVTSFRWDACVASVRCGHPLLRTEKPRLWQVHPLCVEDPFETHLNTCRRVNPRGQRQVLTAAGAALRAALANGGLGRMLGGKGWPLEPAAPAREGGAGR